MDGVVTKGKGKTEKEKRKKRPSRIEIAVVISDTIKTNPSKLLSLNPILTSQVMVLANQGTNVTVPLYK